MPIMQFPPYVLILFISAFINIGLSIYGLRSRRDKVFLYFAISFFVAGLWPLIYGVELLFAERPILDFISKIKPMSMQLFPVFYLCFIYQLVKQKNPPKWIIAAASSFSVVVLFAMLTNDTYHFAWDKQLFITTKEGFNLLIQFPGLLLKYSLVFYHFGVDFIVLSLLIKGIITHKQPYRTQFQLIAVATISIMLVSLVYTFRLADFGPYNPVPASFIFAGTLIYIAVFRYRLLDIVPYARESVFEIIDNPVLIIDNNLNLTDFNTSARVMLKITHGLIGKNINTVFDHMHMDWNDLLENEHTIVQTKWGIGSNYKLSVLKKAVSKGDISGFIVIFTDITTQVDAINTAHEKEIVTYKESILGDMHDGIGGVVATGTILAQSALDDEDTGSKNRKIQQIASLLENGSFELRSMLNILDKKNIDWHSLVSDMRSYSSTVLDSNNINRKFSVQGGMPTTNIHFDKYLSIFRLFKEAITNIIKHSKADNVQIALTFDKDSFKLIVADDGLGISDSKSKGYGLRNMLKRTEKLNGKLEINSENGTNILIEIPV